MIRPFTLLCMASAFGAGLYLYQSKHAAQVLDREITRTLKQTDVTRDRTNMLRAEWALLNEPDRLAELARAHLPLQTLKPTQFAAMADLAGRLPAPVSAHLEALPVAAEPDEAVPVAQQAPPAPIPAAKPRDVVVATETKPKPEPKPEKAVAEAKPTRPAEKPVVARTEPPAAEPRPAEPHFAAAPHPRPPAPAAALASTEATAPGTVGAAVLRAMRAQAAADGRPDMPARSPAPTYAAAPRSYAPAYVQPASNGYAPPAYSAPAYAPAPSVLGGHTALPPPVPFLAR